MMIAGFCIVAAFAFAIIAFYVGTITSSKEKLAAMEAKNKERLALIEKGLDISILDRPTEQKLSFGPLLWGLLLTGTGLGAFIGYLIANAYRLDQTAIMDCMAILLGGIGLIIYYIVRGKVQQQK